MYRKILNALQDFFGISRKEARGALVMMLCCAVVIWTPFVFRRWVLPLVPAGVPPERKVLDSIAVLLEKQQAAGYRRGKRAGGEPRPLPPKHIVLARFDPNEASEEVLMGVGIPAFIARRIVKFRIKGGRFARKEDLMKIYDFPPELYARLERFIVIENAPAAVQSGISETRTYARQQVKVNIAPFDINQCDTTALIRLKGIGSKLAQRILKFRDGLGGFHSADQFAEVYGLDSLALSELKRYAKVNSDVRKVPINTATAEEMGRHPYLRNRKQVQVLLNYRAQHGPFRSLDDLRAVKVLDEATIQKIGPYLSF
ncbi:ComEA family DNA-binding protein [Dyadobacter fermentans]|uniref:DNA uptake protein and related DNA-binding protein-like protein n=1 Tax=Dyadobacter fermentans (strain ATCC 700827 / DSM 18053 / CIP 107007 / KCTC 52180 / NS114) TaxID=471854 RepID=C6W5Y4_DYAFD|nr:helix-hairpin-helix domain-containing protein [Dyadobacter fermentans]ACT96073.1 DNA uptake protein and related DNA-binding protein-like protein [Dyadobacter fermentans DSM 18053]